MSLSSGAEARHEPWVLVKRHGGSWSFPPTFVCLTHNAVVRCLYNYDGTSVRLARRRAGSAV